VGLPVSGFRVSQGIELVVVAPWWDEAMTARHDFCGGHEIERRPRGASRASSLLHLLQRATVCQAMVVRLLAPAEESRRTPKAGNHGLSGIGTLQQM